MITASASSLEFGVLGVDDGPTARQAVTITNDGNANLTISSVSVAGLDPGDFAKTADSSETTLAPTQSRLVSLEYDPTTEGPHTALLEIASDDPADPLLQIPLRGRGTRPPALLQGATLSEFSITPSIAIPDPGATAADISTAGTPLGSYLRRVELITDITHTFAEDLDITLASPQGTVVTLTTDNGGGNDDVFAGTLWSDTADENGQLPFDQDLLDLGGNEGLATDSLYEDGVAESALVPEEALGAFIGEDPNGTWVLTVSDDVSADTGELRSATLRLWHSGNAPARSSPEEFTVVLPGVTGAIPDDGPALSSPMVVSGEGGFLCDLTVTASIEHTFPADLEVILRSPQGTAVTLTSDNGFGDDDVFNGTVWDDGADPDGQVPHTSNDGLATDHLYQNGVLASPLVPEEALAAFHGEDPNGVWTLEIVDDEPMDTGRLTEWRLDIMTCNAALPEIDVSPQSVDFGDQPVSAGPSTPRTVMVTNSGSVPLNFTAPIQIVDGPANGFLFVGAVDSSPLAPMGVRDIMIEFDPVAAGSASAELRIASDDLDEPLVTVALSGNGTVPDIDLSETILTFGEQGVNQGATAPMTLTISNVGDAKLTITGLTLGGADAGEFAIASDTGETSLAPAGSRILGITFAPTSVGVKGAIIALTSDDPDEASLFIDLSGTGVATGPTGRTTADLVDALLGTIPATPFSDFDVNVDGLFDAADVVTNVEAINAP
jgi:subtilisin-like proprotein convertase family protein